LHRIAAAALVILLGAARLAAPARAGECSGMSDYTYDHGTCTDNSSNTADIMRDMYHASDRLEEQRSDRYRTSYGGSFGPGASRGGMRRSIAPTAEQHARSRAYAVAITHANAYVPSAAVRNQLLLTLATSARPKDRPQAIAMMRARLAAFPRLQRELGLPPDEVASAGYPLVLEAYRTYDGETLAPDLGGPTWLAISDFLGRRFESLDGPTRQRAADSMAIFAMVLDVDSHELPRAQVRALSRKLLGSLGIDPARLRLNEIMCRAPVAATIDCSTMQYFASNGKIGRPPFAMRGR